MITEELKQQLKENCLGVKEYFVSALLHPTNHPRLDLEELLKDEHFRLSCRYPKDHTGGSAYLHYVE